MRDRPVNERFGLNRSRVRSVGGVLSRVRHLCLVQTVVAASKTAFAAALLSAGGTLAPLVVGLLAFAIYNTNNIADVEEDAMNRPGQAIVVGRWRTEIATLSACAGSVALVVATVAGGTVGLAVAVVPLGAALVYSLPVVPGTNDRLKDIFLVNTVLVAGAWAVAVTYLPLAFGGGVPTLASVVVCTFFFLRTAVSVEVFNVRDVVGDRRAGVATLPVVTGVTRTKMVLAVLDICSLFVVLAAATTVSLPLTLVTGLGPLAAYSPAVTWSLDRNANLDVLCLAKDAEYLLMGTLVVTHVT